MARVRPGACPSGPSGRHAPDLPRGLARWAGEYRLHMTQARADVSISTIVAFSVA